MKKQSKILSILLAASLTFGSISLPSDPPSPASGASDPVQTDSITITPDPSLAPADAHKDLANIFFQTHSQGGTATDNISKNNYAVYGQAVNSFIEEEKDGSFLRIEHIDSAIIVEKYDPELKKAEPVTKLTLPLPKYGGYFTGANARYLVCGQDNPNDSDEKEVVRIIKYDNDWNELNHLSIYGSNTYEPFEAGSLQMTEMNGTLYIHACHTMYATDKGVHHQANMSFAVNEETMELITKNTTVSAGHGYVSHSFCQRIAQDGTDIYLLDHGDAYPRSIYLQKIDAKLKKVSNALDIIAFDGATGNNNTGGSIGGVEVIGDNIFTAGNCTEQFGELYNPSTYRRNLWVSVVDKNMETSQKLIWLTEHENTGNWNARTPYLIPASDGSCYVMWEDVNEEKEQLGTTGGFFRYNLIYGLTKIAKIKPDGTIDGNIHSIYGRLSDCKPVITSDQKLVWYTTENNSPLFYTLDLNQLDSYEFNGFADIRKCTVTLASDSYTYDSNVKPGAASGPAIVSISYGDYQLQKGIDYDMYYSNNSKAGTGYVNITPKGIFADPTETTHEKLRIPFRVIYPTDTPKPTLEPTLDPTLKPTSEPSTTSSPETPTPEKTPYQEPSWFQSPSPGVTQTSFPEQPTISKKPSVSKSPSATPGTAATQKPSVKTTTAPTKTAPTKTAIPSKNHNQNRTASQTKPSKVKNVKVSNLTGQKLQITWMLQSDVNGYQIQYAQNKKFTKNKKTSSARRYRPYKIISGLSKNKTYYIRIRSYRRQDFGKLYGKWSKTVKCKIKK